MSKDVYIHDTAEVSEKANIGKGTKIWNNAQVREDAVIGENCIISKDVYIDTNAKVGNNCKIQNSTSVFNGVTLEDDVFVGPNVSFTNDKHPRAFNKDWVITETQIKKGASLGANCTILCGITIGEYALVAAGSVVTKDVKPYSLVMGNPASHIGQVNEMARPAELEVQIEDELKKKKIFNKLSKEDMETKFIKDRNIRIAIIGATNAGKNQLRVMSSMKGVDVASIYDSDEHNLTSISKDIDVRTTTVLEEALNEVDAIIIATHAKTHLQYFKAAMGKVNFVFIEKPLASNYEESCEIKKLAEEFGVIVQVGYIERFNPAILALKKITSTEKVINSDFSRTNRLSDRVLDIDIVNDLMSHDIDLALHLNGPIVDVNAYGRKSERHLSYINGFFKHENGAFSRIVASRITEKKIRKVEVTTDNSYIDCELKRKEVKISRLSTFNNEDGQLTNISSQEQQVEVDYQEALFLQMQSFVKICQGTEQIVPDLNEAIEVMRVSEQVLERIHE